MKAESLLAVLMLVLSSPVVASGFISVKFVVDGKPISCSSTVQLRLDGRTIVPKRTDRGFNVPAVFDENPSDRSPNKSVDVTVSCGEYTLVLPKVPAGWVSAGQWEAGIAYPPYWIKQFWYLEALEKGTWLSYLESECNGCDPGVFTTISHPNPPKPVVASLRREQPGSSGERARDLAYALAVFDTEYQRNRDYLLETLKACLARPKESPEDDVCDGRLLDYVTNLYWRGDSALLQPLLQLADSRRDVIGDAGRFYAKLLERHTAVTVDGLRQLTPEKQRVICRLAGEDEYSHDEPMFERVAKRLHGIGDETANQCLQIAEQAANDVPWRQKPK